jgi:hypothetical protein
MKTITLKEAFNEASKGKLDGCKRVHPHIDVGNGEGPRPMPEISVELKGGDWYDVGYCHLHADAALLAHCRNHFRELVKALEGILPHLESDLLCHDEWSDEITACQLAVIKANKVRTP